jgi:hypothetical protein
MRALFASAWLVSALAAGCGRGVPPLQAAAAALVAEAVRAPVAPLAVAAAAATLTVTSLDRAGAQRLLAAVERAAPAVRRLAFVGKDGRVFASLGDPPEGAAAADVRAVAVLAAAPGPYLGPLGEGGSPSAAACAGAAIVGPEGAVVGALVADVDAQVVWAAVEAVLGERAAARCVLRDADGRALVSPGADPAPDGPAPADAAPLPGLAGWSLACR